MCALWSSLVERLCSTETLQMFRNSLLGRGLRLTHCLERVRVSPVLTSIANLLISKPNVFIANDTRVLSGQLSFREWLMTEWR